jgi:hypothetical protein
LGSLFVFLIFVWLSIISSVVFWHLPPGVGCDPRQDYFQKTIPGSKWDCNGCISAL